jgi:CTP-dependent riboflavin kinase
VNDREDNDRRGRIEVAREKVEYYNQSRSKLIGNVLENLESPKEPAVAGIIVVAPLIITLFVVAWLFEKLNQVPGNQYFNIFQTDNELLNFYMNQSVKLFILLIIGAVIVTGVGRFVRTRAGFQVEKGLDAFMDSVPFLGSIYNITKVTADTVLAVPEGFREPVKLEAGALRTTAFKTGNVADDGREIVFMPTSPNITTGFVLEVDKERLTGTGETAEEALTRVLSAGFGSSRSREDEDATVKGELFTGMGDGADYIGMEPYQEKIEAVTGYRPFPGTLNLRVEPEELEELKKGREPEVIEEFKYQGQQCSQLEVYPVKVNGEKAAYIDIEITDYGGDVMEIIAPEYLRGKLDLEDGEEVEVALVEDY